MKDRDIIKALSDPAEFKRLITNVTSLEFIVRTLPAHADKIIGLVLSDPAEFKRLIPDVNNLEFIARRLPAHADKMISPVLSDPAEFKRLITDASALEFIARSLPAHADKMISLVLSDQTEFKRLITDTSGLKFIAKLYPNEIILNAGNYNIALALVKERERKKQLSQVGIASSTLGQGRRDEKNPFSSFPRDVLIKIAKHTTDEKAFNDDQVHKKATESFEHPSKRKK